ncbi:MAG: four helix bundle protein [Bacteroidales bacterium]
MSEEKKPYDLRERLLLFAKRMLEICKILPPYPECNRIRGQLGGSGTSVGANYEEADGTISKKDFVNKLAISRKEAKETRYFLRVISGTYLAPATISKDIRESEEIINILSSMINKSTSGRIS